MPPELRSRLLRIARRALHEYLAGNDPLDVDCTDWPDPTRYGAFVTLECHGRLRGCIGTFHPDAPLAETVRDLAVASAQDPRFRDHPLRLAELDRLRIEISVLTPLERTARPEALEVGRHGIYIRHGRQTGCLLPQVASRFAWTAEEFLDRCCVEKAGLPADAWRDPATEVFLFESETIEDEPA